MTNPGLTGLPSFVQGDTSHPVEILASMSPPPLKKGCTLKPAQGWLMKGQLIAKETATGTYVKYNDAGSGGAEICKGILAEDRNTGAAGTTQPVGGNIYLRGTFYRDKLIGLNAAAVADLNAREDTDRNYLIVA
jgi:hypothetical protein